MKYYALFFITSLTIHTSLPPIKPTKTQTLSNNTAEKLAEIYAQRDMITTLYTLTTLSSKDPHRITKQVAHESIARTFCMEVESVSGLVEKLNKEELSIPLGTQLDRRLYSYLILKYSNLLLAHSSVASERLDLILSQIELPR